LKDVVITQLKWPAVGVGHGCVEIIVNLLQDRHQALLVDDLLLVGQRLAGAKFLKHVIDAVRASVGYWACLAFAVSIKLLRKRADAGFMRILAYWEWNGSKQRPFV